MGIIILMAMFLCFMLVLVIVPDDITDAICKVIRAWKGEK